MTKRVTLIAAVCLLALSGLYFRVRITPDALRARIQEDLPVGSSSEKVLRFLDSLGAVHSGPLSSDFDSDFPGRTRMIVASIEGLRRGNLLADGVFMKFKLDDQDRLLDFRVWYSFTGP